MEEDLEDEKNYRPIICLNTSYILKELIAKYMCEHTMVRKSEAKENLQW